MQYLLRVACAFIFCILPAEQLCQGRKKIVHCFVSFGQKTTANAQAAVDLVTGLPKALQDQVASCLGHRTSERLRVCGSNLLSGLVRWSAVMCLLAIVTLVLFPAVCACVLTAVVAAYVEMSWVFWLLLLDFVSIAVVCTSWSRCFFQAISDPADRSCIAISQNLEHAASIFQSGFKSYFSKATAYVEDTVFFSVLKAVKKLRALVWWLMGYPFVLLAMVSRLQLPTFPSLLPGMLL